MTANDTRMTRELHLRDAGDGRELHAHRRRLAANSLQIAFYIRITRDLHANYQVPDDAGNIFSVSGSEQAVKVEASYLVFTNVRRKLSPV